MRVLTVTSLYPNPIQPHRAAFNRQQLDALSRHHELRVIAPIAWTDELQARWRGACPGAAYGAGDDGPAVEHPRYFFVPRLVPGLQGHFYRRSIRRAFARAVAEFEPDVVYAPWAYPDGWAAVRLGHEAGVPVVIKVLGSDVLLLPTYRRRLRPTREALRRADCVVAVSKHLAARVGDLGVDPAKIHVVYDGIDAGLFHPGSRADARDRLRLRTGLPMILFVGNLLPVKAPNLLVEACSRLANEGNRFVCNIIGQGPLRAKLEQQIRELGLTGRIKLRGPVSHHLLPDWFRAASVVALSSLSEGVPNVLLEAAACGTPFVASNVGGIPEIAHLGVSRLVPAGSVPLLAQALQPFVEEPASDTPEPNPVSLPSWEDSATDLADVLDVAVHAHRMQSVLAPR